MAKNVMIIVKKISELNTTDTISLLIKIILPLPVNSPVLQFVNDIATSGFAIKCSILGLPTKSFGLSWENCRIWVLTPIIKFYTHLKYNAFWLLSSAYVLPNIMVIHKKNSKTN